MNKGEKRLKLCSSDCVDPILFVWIGHGTYHMSLTNDLCKLHKGRSSISIGMNSKQYVDGSEWSEHKKHTNMIQFECKKRNVARVLKYFKYTYPSNITAVKVEKSLGYNCYFISMVGPSGYILDPSISQVLRVKIQAIITDHLVYKRWGLIHSDRLEYDLRQY